MTQLMHQLLCRSPTPTKGDLSFTLTGFGKYCVRVMYVWYSCTSCRCISSGCSWVCIWSSGPAWQFSILHTVRMLVAKFLDAHIPACIKLDHRTVIFGRDDIHFSKSSEKDTEFIVLDCPKHRKMLSRRHAVLSRHLSSGYSEHQVLITVKLSLHPLSSEYYSQLGSTKLSQP